MRTAIIGLERSGKTSVFNALTGQNKKVDTFGKIEADIAVVKVPDTRVDFLLKTYQPKKMQLAEIEFLDIPGSINNSSDAKILGCAREADAFCMVLRDFENDLVPGRPGGNDPEKDLEEIVTGLILADMAVCEKRIEALIKSRNKASFGDSEEKELVALKKVYSTLENTLPAKEASLSENEEKILRSFQLLTLKNHLEILNVSEKNINSSAAEAKLKKMPGAILMCAKLESELQELSEEDRKEFMRDLEMEQLSIGSFIKKAYSSLGLISFFTAGEKEVKVWTVKKGSSALQAAGKIHSDIARGFIQAEIFNWDDLKKYGSEKEIKRKGLLRTEGKEYEVKDGDILNIKFNV